MKRHNRAEVVAKLRQADEMARRGQPQSAICKSLGISVMTFHRWRKEIGHLSEAAISDDPADSVASADRTMTQAQIEELQAENRRLRKIVTDLLLEKSKIEEALARRKIRA
jgi:hypothetical protein